MPNSLSDRLRQLNSLIAETDALYHQASQRIGISDSAMRILYTVHEHGESCLLSDVYKESGISRQTVNSALRKLEEENILFLEKFRGKSKRIRLSEQGRALMQQTAAQLYDAELRALSTWTQEELDTHIRLTEKYASAFREQVEAL